MDDVNLETILLIDESKLSAEEKEQLKEATVSLFSETHHRLPNPQEEQNLQKVLISDYNKVMTEKKIRLLTAFNTLGTVLPVKLPQKDWEDIKKELQAATEKNVTEETLSKAKNFQELLGFSDHTMEQIYQVGVDLLQENRSEEAMYFFDLLVTLDPEFPYYWLGYGESLKNQNHLEQALYCFGMTYMYDDKPLFARARSIECYLQLGEKEDAKLELTELEQLVKGDSELEKTWKPFIDDFKNQIKSVK